jgi:hypothetical protein
MESFGHVEKIEIHLGLFGGRLTEVQKNILYLLLRRPTYVTGGRVLTFSYPMVLRVRHTTESTCGPFLFGVR